MAEYVYNPIQLVEPNQNVLLRGSIPCNKGYVYHREESGILTLRGVVNGCGCFARYQVTFNGNIAVPEDGTVGPIAIALAIDGEPIQTSRAIVTPAAVDEYGNVTSATIPLTIVSQCAEAYSTRTMKTVACGFGTGLSWATIFMETNNLVLPEVIIYE